MAYTEPVNELSSGSGPEKGPRTLSEEIAEMLAHQFGEMYGFDNETLREIAQLPFEEAFETAYGYLTQAGLDPDEILAPWME